MDNDGLPHTLEHLIFLGSEDYPYKEVLDLLANRALADRYDNVLMDCGKYFDAQLKIIKGPMPGQTQITLATPSTPLDPVDFFIFFPSTWTIFCTRH